VITRRSLIAGILSAAAAPAIVKPASLMPIWVPKSGLRERNEVIDDMVLQAWQRHESAYQNFVSHQLHRIARDLGVPYAILSESMGQATYSLARECLTPYIQTQSRLLR
jgi:hypothetical protein